MNALTITVGTVGVLHEPRLWASFLSGAWRMAKTVQIGQSAPDRWRPFLPPLQADDRRVHRAHPDADSAPWAGAHWLVMIGFLGGAALWFERTADFDPTFPLAAVRQHVGVAPVGRDPGYRHRGRHPDLIVIRQLNHPRIPERLSRFAGSKFTPAYFVESSSCSRALGMILVRPAASR